VTVYSPTRAAFLQKKDGTFDACWTYWTGPKHYTYQIPADNSYDETPKQVPSDSYPEKAAEFEAQTAIGGGPVLINAGKYANTWSEEMFDVGGVNPTSNNPRTAIGVTAEKKLVFFVCEGRNQTEGVAGLTTEDLANVLMDLGCVEAINLDGGGSSCMLVNGKETIKVSDGSQRAVASTVMIM
jgi:exopolysaccharide biosynthesis protein